MNHHKPMSFLFTLLILLSGAILSLAQDGADISPDEPLTLERGGIVVELPAGALYDYADADFLLTPTTWDIDPVEGMFDVIGEPFTFDLSNEDVFAAPVQMRIPYDPDMLPPGMPESNVFATHYRDGEWHRVRGRVDTENNVIIVDTLHNGLWLWAADTVGNVNREAREFLNLASDGPRTVAEAQAEVDARYDEWLESIARLQIASEELEEALDVTEFAGLVVESIWDDIKIHVTDATVKGLAGKSALLTIGSHSIGVWGGAFATGIALGGYSGHIAGETILGVRAIALNLQAYARLQEARAVLEALENPDQTSFYPQDALYIEDFAEIQLANQKDDGTISIDWDVTAWPDELVEPEVARLDLAIAAISGGGEAVADTGADPAPAGNAFASRYDPLDYITNNNLQLEWACDTLYHYSGGDACEFANTDISVSAWDVNRLNDPEFYESLRCSPWLPLDGSTLNFTGRTHIWTGEQNPDLRSVNTWSPAAFSPTGTVTVAGSQGDTRLIVYSGQATSVSNLSGGRLATTTTGRFYQETCYYDEVSGAMVAHFYQSMQYLCESEDADGCGGDDSALARVVYLTGSNLPHLANGVDPSALEEVEPLTLDDVPEHVAPPSEAEADAEAPPEPDEPAPATCTVSANGVNLRGGPGTGFNVAGTLSGAATATGQTTAGDGFVWYQLDGGAWVRSDVVSDEAACSNLPQVDG